MNEYKAKALKILKDDYIYLLFLIGFASMFGSLYFQFILNLPPCALCYVQRYFHYPIAIISMILILFKKKINSLFFLILSVPGLLVAIYHVYIQSVGVPNTLSFAPCTIEVPCEVIDIKLLGFITIPMLSVLAFATITLIVIVSWYLNKKKSN
ncbi:MAG: disulfide bond formation protein B [Candidatus Dojkabacteria bacterium]